MFFSSVFFVFFFFALNLLANNFAGNIRQKNLILLIFSLIFYFLGGPEYLLVLLAMVFSTWIFSLWVDQLDDRKKKKIFLVSNCVILLGLFGIFRYLNFFTGITNFLFHIPKEATQMVLPIGMSFYTLRLLSYMTDVYRGRIPAQKNFRNFLLYASLFHLSMAGPIVRYPSIADEIDHRKVRLDEMSRGVKRFSVGLAKQAILANGCASAADLLLPAATEDLARIPAAGLWIGVIFYALQIFLSFSAYTDMALGMGLMVGFHYEENFDYPYTAFSIKDFLRKWNISLNAFFQDYLYESLGGDTKGTVRTVINFLIVGGLMGLWYGAGWNYILWGLYLLAFLFLENIFLSQKLEKLPSAAGHIYTIIVLYFGWILFRCENMSGLGTILKGMIGLNGNGFFGKDTAAVIGNHVFLLIFCIAASTPVLKWLGEYMRRLQELRQRVPYVFYVYETAIVPILLFLSLMALV